MKKVCMIAYTRYSFDNRVRREAEAVNSLPAYSVTVLTPREQDAPRNYEKGGVRIVELNMPKYQGKRWVSYIFSYIRFTFLAFIACTKLVFRKSLDIIHVHNMPNFLVFAGLIPLLAGKPIILDEHDTVVETYAAKFKGRYSRVLERLLRLEEAICCRMASRIVCVNDIQKAILVARNIPEEKIVVAMNVPDPTLFGNTGTARGGKETNGKLRMIYHGTVTKRLGVDMAVRAVMKLCDVLPELEFHILGDGDGMKELQDLGRSLGSGNKVQFRGIVPLEKLVPILGGMDLGIIPNRKNIATDLMLPVKMLECVALGIPVVAPRLKTISHYFTEDMVFYFEPDDIDSMAQAILTASSNEEERARKAREAKGFLGKHGWQYHKAAFLEMYKSL
jgi:glycosyltransferase involved in cell wall biosynthesis